ALAGRYGHLLVRGTLGRGATHAAVRATRDHFLGTPFPTRHGILRSVTAMDLRQAGATISLPTTVVVGRRDPLTPPRHSRLMASTIPTARLVELPGRGHMLPLEAPDEIVEIIAGHH
ncbi:MAG TPA: alpha/beta hydrolase, partial [Acidimicrobiales bacterium]|nr:alpha/beta hydrolase [Acidimicrobiales bacterium]